MLRITLHDSPNALTFRLEGKLIGPWAQEFERTWRTAASIRGGKPAIVDLTDVIFIDADGERALALVVHDGGEFKATAPLTKSIVQRVRAGLRSSAGLAMLLLGVVFLSFSQTPAAEAPEPPLRLTLSDAVRIALKENPAVLTANLNLAESEQDSLAARSALLPQLGVEVSDSLHRANLAAGFGKPFPGFPLHIGPYYVVQAGPSMSVPLFDLTLWKRYRAARESARGAAADQSTVREENVLLVVSQYLGCLRASADVKAAQSRVQLAKNLYDLASDLQKQGVGIRIDTLRANVQYQNEQQRLITAETTHETSLYGLARLLNLDPRQSIELTDEVRFFETPKYNADSSLASALVSRPEMKALEARLRATDYQKQAARAERLPKLAFDGFWAQQGITPTTIIPVYTYEAGISVPLFTGGRIRSEIAVAGLERQKLEQQERDLRARIALEVKTAAAQLEAARHEVDVANLGVKLAAEELDQAGDRFKAGVANNIEVVTAQDELARANDNQIVALYRYNQARADLAHATGQMESLYAK